MVKVLDQPKVVRSKARSGRKPALPPVSVRTKKPESSQQLPSIDPKDWGAVIQDALAKIGKFDLDKLYVTIRKDYPESYPRPPYKDGLEAHFSYLEKIEKYLVLHDENKIPWGRFITDEFDPTPFEKMDMFTAANPGKPISEFVRGLVPEILKSIDKSNPLKLVQATSSPANSLPDQAPELWVNRRPDDVTPGHFIQRVYGQWFADPAFHSGYVRRLDPSLERAYDRWIRKGSPKAPEGFYLPTKQDAIDAEGTPTDDDVQTAKHVDRVRSREYRSRQTSR